MNTARGSLLVLVIGGLGLSAGGCGGDNPGGGGDAATDAVVDAAVDAVVTADASVVPDAGDAQACEPELCDGVDNDCDGDVDEDCPCVDGQVQACYTGPLATQNVGECHDGTQICDVQGIWGSCAGEQTPTPELCNGLDDDCDPATTDGSQDPQNSVPCDGPDSDLCPEGTNSCTGGALTCSDNTDDLLDVCDGADNDCDPSTPDGAHDPQSGAACDGPDSDLCTEGTYTCNGGVLTCSDNTGDTLDVCDGVDNDCDPSSADGTEDSQNGAACDGSDSDLCLEGTYTCSGGGLVCSDNTGSTPDLCDGGDNDCDPSSPDGAEDPQNGAPCDGSDSDLCPEGVYSCVGGVLSCSDTSASDLDVCDGVDNDCDPASPDGSEDAQNGAPCDGADSDLCVEGTYACVGGALACSDNTTSEQDICDGVDNDCDPASPDGSEDPLNGAPCDGPDSDFCAEGTWSCAAGGVLSCSDTSGDDVEICDGVDNDCDGTADDGNPGGGGLCDTGLLGVCQAGTETCQGGFIVCVQDIPAAPEVCGDSLDNDCDGTVDNGCSSCPPGYEDCDGNASNGCETHIWSDGDACGNCTTTCADTEFCSTGSCVACAGGLRDCDRDGANACESDTASDALNCGTCGTVCGDSSGGLCCGSTCTVPDVNDCGACGETCFTGMLVINELLINPDASLDANGEWFELYNPNSFDVDVRGFDLRDDGTDSHVVVSPTPVIIPAGGYAVLGKSANPLLNGNAPVIYGYGGDISLGNSGDELVVEAYGTLIDSFPGPGSSWSGGFEPVGASMELSTNHDNHTDNDQETNWCPAITPFGDGDLGTPGAVNDCAL